MWYFYYWLWKLQHSSQNNTTTATPTATHKSSINRIHRNVQLYIMQHCVNQNKFNMLDFGVSLYCDSMHHDCKESCIEMWNNTHSDLVYSLLGVEQDAVGVQTRAKRSWPAESQHFENQPQMALFLNSMPIFVAIGRAIYICCRNYKYASRFCLRAQTGHQMSDF